MKPSVLAVALTRLNIGRVAYAVTEWNALNRKATSWFQQGNYTKAAVAATKAVQAAEQVLGPDHPDVATGLNNLGMLCYAREQFTKAETLHKRALTIREKALGPDDAELASILDNYAALLLKTNHTAEAAQAEARAKAIRAKTTDTASSDPAN